ncbi:hypothetical protein C7M71_016605 [Peterkaempfera bronchialis]|uniref:Uncharacterized protein n=1 Tax=Peterkaempfera bronchialis TaxID=2126346 RepID=A0A345SYJ0_9ACTN|nr:hypothetical protein C7M71_016605 [Peterkaempfera bronchialis]
MHLPDGPSDYRLDLRTAVGDTHPGDVPRSDSSSRTIAASTTTGDITLLHDGS